MGTVKVGIDVGGTFTDASAVDLATGQTWLAKVVTTADPLEGITEALDKVLRAAGKAVPEALVHGTTLVTNAMLERRGARTGLITTRGFRDVLEIRRLSRPPAYMYDLRIRLPAPLVPRKWRFEVTERVNYRGEVVTPLETAELEDLADAIQAEGIEAIAVSFLFSYTNPAHEVAVGAALRERLPGLAVSAASELLPQVGEYERTSTTVVNAYLKPVVAAYLNRLRSQVGPRVNGKVFVIQSNGGMAAPEAVARRPSTLLLSGPAGGVVAGRYLSEALSWPNVITADMGGTSFDVSLIAGGQVYYSEEMVISGHPVRVPMVGIDTIGAGGGSIGWVDEGGHFRVGPRSAGARPGPACYGRGGQEATVTDACLVLGYLGAERPLGGEVIVSPALARAACARLGDKLGLSPEDTAAGVFTIVTSMMADATRVVSVGRGHDPRDFMLIAFGGAGPIHAWEIARRLGIPWAVSPPSPGVMSAYGMILCDLHHEYVQSYVARFGQVIETAVRRLWESMVVEAHRDLEQDGIPAAQHVLEAACDMRYVGQDWVVTVPRPFMPFSGEHFAAAAADFHRMHAIRYGFSAEGEEVEVVNLRLRGNAIVPKPTLAAAIDEGREMTAAALLGRRSAFFSDGGGWVPTAVIDRAALRPGNVLKGPAVVQQDDATTLIPPGAVAKVDPYLNLIIGEKEWRLA